MEKKTGYQLKIKIKDLWKFGSKDLSMIIKSRAIECMVYQKFESNNLISAFFVSSFTWLATFLFWLFQN